MSVLQTRLIRADGNQKQEFILHVLSGFNLMREAITRAQNLTQVVGGIVDKSNLLLLKKQLGMERQELMLKQIMTKNNAVGDADIGNNFNNQKYQLVKKYNDMICLFLLYFIHESTWLTQPQYAHHATVATFTGNIAIASQPAQYADSIPTGYAYQDIFEKIKKVLPFLSNLFMELIEDKYPTSTSVQVAEYQDLQERLNQAQLTGSIAKEAKKVKKGNLIIINLKRINSKSFNK